MTKFLLIPVLVTASVAAGQAKGFSFGPFVEAGWPTGNLKQNYKTGIGLGFGADVRLGKVGLTGSIGYMYFGGTSIDNGDEIVDPSSFKTIPMRAGIKYRLVPGLYAKLESGVAKFTGTNESALIFSPGIGVRILGFDLQAKYELWKWQDSFSFLGLKAGFNF